MSDTLTFAELEAQHVELLPARTVLSLFIAAPGKPGIPGTPGGSTCGIPCLFSMSTVGGTSIMSAGVGTGGTGGTANPG